jgi:hypothetical protein
LTRGENQPDIWISWSGAQDKAPFGVPEGRCLYNTGSLFFFDGNSTAGNVLMVLWQFPMSLSGKRKITSFDGGGGVGLLNATPAAGALAPGSIEWEIITLNSANLDRRIGNWDQAMRAMTLTPAPQRVWE